MLMADLVCSPDINGRHVARNELHDTMSALFANSVFADKTESDERTIGRATIVSRGRSPKAQTVTSPKKYLERHPVFCLFLRLPWDQVEFGLETAKRVVYFQVLISLPVSDNVITESFHLAEFD